MKLFRSKIFRIVAIVAVSAILLGSVASIGVFAYLSSTGDELVNEFIPAVVTCQVQRQTENNAERNITVKNTGNINAYIRAYVTVNWEAVDTDTDSYLGKTPVDNTDYTIKMSENGWTLGADGFWYYSVSVMPEEITQNLVDEVVLVGEAPENYRLNVTVLASAIQAEPEMVVEEQWNVTVENGILSPK